MTYKFHKDVLSPIISHIAAYDLIITSILFENEHYTITTNNSISQEEVIHLQEEYQLEIV